MTSMEIFQAVANGKLTPEQGAKLLMDDKPRLGPEQIVTVIFIALMFAAGTAMAIWGPK